MAHKHVSHSFVACSLLNKVKKNKNTHTKHYGIRTTRISKSLIDIHGVGARKIAAQNADGGGNPPIVAKHVGRQAPNAPGPKTGTAKALAQQPAQHVAPTTGPASICS
ncbi:unnamed protein product [Rotaria magnacalcarata]|uniref:Uncharacterized protein n=1 Tax=Rotaria magnacalcarata TaxID=392030 RepID=A0A816EDG8_9BILA|nr:unnamed protein product [Rotaria magnacalcarata]CAF1645186.1 unnamed protein product [Rotaria magnacalcarata]